MVKEYNLNNENFRLFLLNKYFEKSFNENTEHNLEGIHIYFSLKGMGRYKSLLSNHQVEAKENSTGIDLIRSGNQGILSIPENTHKQSLSLFVKKEYILKALSLNKNTEKIHDFFDKQLYIQNLKNKKINPKSVLIVNEIITNPYSNDLEKLSLEAKVLDLLYYELSELFHVQEEKNNQILLSKEDKESIYHAKEILRTNLQNPPSIKQLAKEVGINEFKLKFGFEKLFHNTPYNFSLEKRLEESKMLLESSEYNINEIALKVGYKYSQSFSNAFFKKFGVRPKELMKNRDYYY